MHRRDFFKVVAGGVVGVLVAPVLAKEVRGIDCSKSTRWENYYQGWPKQWDAGVEANQKMLEDMDRLMRWRGTIFYYEHQLK